MSKKDLNKNTEQIEETVNNNKNDKVKNAVPFYKKPGFRYSILATVLSIVFIVVIVVVNIAASMLDARFNALQLDMTSNQTYSITKENVDYIKKIDKDITVTVACTESYYANSYGSFVANNMYYSDPSNGQYFNQTVQLLKKYPKENNKITLQFIDPQTPAFDKFSEKYNGKYTYGTIIVECSFTNKEGKDQERSKLLQAEDVYDIQSSDGSTSASDSNVIAGNKLEQALTSALYYVSSEQQTKAAVITGYGCDSATGLTTLLSDNNYDIEEIDSLTTNDIPDDVKMLIIAAPTSDMTPAEIKKLDTFMRGHKEYGRNIIYVGSNTQHALKNLDTFMDEWGITLGTGTVYETDENYFYPSINTYMVLQDGGTDYTTDTASSAVYLCQDIRPITLKFEQSDAYYTYDIVKTNDSTTVKPSGSKDDWAPSSSDKKQSYVGLALSTYAAGTDDDSNVLASNILTIASLDFYNTEYSTSYGRNNLDTLITVINSISGRTEQTYTVTSKKINSTAFTVSEVQANIIFYVTVYVIPVLLIVVAIFVVIRRKRK